MLWKLAIVRHLQRTQLFFGGGNMNSGETTKFRKFVLNDKELWRFSSEKPNEWKILSLIWWQRKDRVGIRLKISQLLTTAHFLWITFFKIRNIFGIHFFSADFKNFTNKRGFSYLTSEGRVEAMGGGLAPNGGCTEN